MAETMAGPLIWHLRDCACWVSEYSICINRKHACPICAFAWLNIDSTPVRDVVIMRAMGSHQANNLPRCRCQAWFAIQHP